MSGSNPIDRQSVYIAVGLLSGIGVLISTTMPMVIGAMIESLGINESQAGDVVAVFSLTFTAIAFASLFFIRKINWKLLSLLLSAICIGTLFFVPQVLGSAQGAQYRALIYIFGIMGIGMGGLYALGMTVMGDSENPDKAFGLKLGYENLPAIIALFAIPALIIPQYGFKGLMYALGAMALIAAPLSFLLPSKGIKGTAASISEGKPQAKYMPLLIINLIASIIFFSGVIAVWAFLEVMGGIKGIATDKVGIILALAMFSAMIGAFVAAGLGNKRGRNIPMIGIIIVNVLSAALIWTSSSFAIFAIGAIAFVFCINFALAYFFALSADMDIGGGFVALSAAALSIGGAIGPSTAGRLMESHGLGGVLLFASACVVLSLVMYLVVVNRSQLEN